MLESKEQLETLIKSGLTPECQRRTGEKLIIKEIEQVLDNLPQINGLLSLKLPTAAGLMTYLSSVQKALALYKAVVSASPNLESSWKLDVMHLLVYGSLPIWQKHYAMNSFEDILNQYLQEGGDPNIYINGLPLIYHLAKTQDIGLIRKLLSIDATNPNSLTPNHHTALFYLCAKGNANGVEELLSRGANAALMTNKSVTPLHAACNISDRKPENSVAIVDQLLEHHVNVNVTSSLGLTPLHCAVIKNSEKIIYRLLQRGAFTDFRDELGETPLFKAVSIPYEPLFMTVRLLCAGACPNLPNKQMITPLHRAVAIGRIEIAAVLLLAGAEPFPLDKIEDTALKQTYQQLLDKLPLFFEHCREVTKSELRSQRRQTSTRHSYPAANLRRLSAVVRENALECKALLWSRGVRRSAAKSCRQQQLESELLEIHFRFNRWQAASADKHHGVSHTVTREGRQTSPKV